MDFVNKPNTHQITCERIRRDIVLGNLVAGNKLKLSPLSEQYSVSMLTLRNVLHSLSSEGFVRAENQKGFYIAALTKQNLLELADARYLIEGYMMEKSFEQGDLDWESKIQSAYHILHRKEEIFLGSLDDTDANNSAMLELKLYDYDFHCALTAKCGSSELLAIHKIVFDKYLRYLLKGNGLRGQLAMDEHDTFLEASLSKNVKLAKKVLKTHIYECVEILCSHQENWLGNS